VPVKDLGRSRRQEAGGRLKFSNVEKSAQAFDTAAVNGKHDLHGQVKLQ
jgi:hypothetical protein